MCCSYHSAYAAGQDDLRKENTAVCRTIRARACFWRPPTRESRVRLALAPIVSCYPVTTRHLRGRMACRTANCELAVQAFLGKAWRFQAANITPARARHPGWTHYNPLISQWRDGEPIASVPSSCSVSMQRSRQKKHPLGALLAGEWCVGRPCPGPGRTAWCGWTSQMLIAPTGPGWFRKVG